MHLFFHINKHSNIETEPYFKWLRKLTWANYSLTGVLSTVKVKVAEERLTRG